MSLFQAFDENEKEIKNTFSSNLPFGTNIGGRAPFDLLKITFRQ